MWHRVAALQILENQRSYGFEIALKERIIDAFIVCSRNGQWFAYVNHCPHQGLNLNWHPHQFLDHKAQFLVCSMHMALFSIETGECLHGPCLGQSLHPLAIKIEDRVIWVNIHD